MRPTRLSLALVEWLLAPAARIHHEEQSHGAQLPRFEARALPTLCLVVVSGNRPIEARAVRRVLGWKRERRDASSPPLDGIFIYAHVERLAFYRAPDGTVRRDAFDTALQALVEELMSDGGVECRELQKTMAAPHPQLYPTTPPRTLQRSAHTQPPHQS